MSIEDFERFRKDLHHSPFISKIQDQAFFLCGIYYGILVYQEQQNKGIFISKDMNGAFAAILDNCGNFDCRGFPLVQTNHEGITQDLECNKNRRNKNLEESR